MLNVIYCFTTTFLFQTPQTKTRKVALYGKNVSGWFVMKQNCQKHLLNWRNVKWRAKKVMSHVSHVNWNLKVPKKPQGERNQFQCHQFFLSHKRLYILLKTKSVEEKQKNLNSSKSMKGTLQNTQAACVLKSLTILLGEWFKPETQCRRLKIINNRTKIPPTTPEIIRKQRNNKTILGIGT